ncbi:hypothetical protein MVES_000003 [Malassezia vespertilionis]|uniref:Dynactin subunit 6 n=1 Tax=Malassezia vespertilionis TaxID=2020962 RepID=A0A2N1JGE7_9BASI|nr:hypothetical protein MVES_000003 [Malassezia vespertilionis]
MSVTVQPRAIVAAEADVKGDVTIGSGTVVHPRARIHATSAPIVLGNNCIVEELATIDNEPMTVGDGNVFRVSSLVRAQTTGNCNVFEARCSVASNVHVSNFCVIGAGCVVESADNTLVHLDERSAIYETCEARQAACVPQ